MKNRTNHIFIIIFTFSFLLGNEMNREFYPTGEKLIYSAKFEFISVGESTLELLKDVKNNNSSFKIISTIKSNSFLSKIHKINDHIQVWIDSTYTVLRKDKKVHYKSHTSVINQEKSEILFDNKIIPFSGKIYDPLSIIYYLRTLELNIGDDFNFTAYDIGKLKQIQVEVSDIETIRVPSGKYKCKVVRPTFKDGKSFKNDGQMIIWYSIDELQIPVKIELKTKYGSMVLELKSRKTIKN